MTEPPRRPRDPLAIVKMEAYFEVRGLDFEAKVQAIRATTRTLDDLTFRSVRA